MRGLHNGERVELFHHEVEQTKAGLNATVSDPFLLIIICWC